MFSTSSRLDVKETTALATSSSSSAPTSPSISPEQLLAASEVGVAAPILDAKQPEQLDSEVGPREMLGQIYDPQPAGCDTTEGGDLPKQNLAPVFDEAVESKPEVTAVEKSEVIQPASSKVKNKDIVEIEDRYCALTREKNSKFKPNAMKTNS